MLLVLFSKYSVNLMIEGDYKANSSFESCPTVALQNNLEQPLLFARQKPLNIHTQPSITARIHISKGHIISGSISARSSQISLFSFLTDTYIKHYFFSLPQPLRRSKGQKQCEIMSLLRGGL